METAGEQNLRIAARKAKLRRRKYDEVCDSCQEKEVVYGNPQTHESGTITKERVGYRRYVASFMGVACDDCRVELHSNNGWMYANGVTASHCPKCKRKYGI